MRGWSLLPKATAIRSDYVEGSCKRTLSWLWEVLTEPSGRSDEPSTFGGSRLQGMNVLQVAVGPSVVNPVSHHEHIGHLKSHVLHVQVDLPPRGLGEKSEHLQGRGIAGEQEASQVREREVREYHHRSAQDTNKQGLLTLVILGNMLTQLAHLLLNLLGAEEHLFDLEHRCEDRLPFLFSHRPRPHTRCVAFG